LREFADLVGIPYARHGRDERGLDCFGLVWLAARRLGTPIGDPWYSGFDPSLADLAESIGLRRIDGVRPGCAIEMVRDGRLHLGLALDERRMMHAVLGEGVVVADIGSIPAKGFWAFAGGGAWE